MDFLVFPFFGGINGDEPIPDRDYEDLFEEDYADEDSNPAEE